jgi:hypothetical protein
MNGDITRFVLIFILLFVVSLILLVFTKSQKITYAGGRANFRVISKIKENAIKPIIIHISGASGSGKTSLGDELQRLYPLKIAVKDTDEFIQPQNKAGKLLQSMRNSKSYNAKEYEKKWREIIDSKVTKFIKSNPNKIIVFTGLMNNFGPKEHDTLY